MITKPSINIEIKNVYLCQEILPHGSQPVQERESPHDLLRLPHLQALVQPPDNGMCPLNEVLHTELHGQGTGQREPIEHEILQ